MPDPPNSIPIKNPIIGNAINACWVVPKSAAKRAIIEISELKIRTLRLSINFNSTRPKRVPKVIIPQKFEIVLAP